VQGSNATPIPTESDGVDVLKFDPGVVERCTDGELREAGVHLHSGEAFLLRREDHLAIFDQSRG
jgi:hypothetical protein